MRAECRASTERGRLQIDLYVATVRSRIARIISQGQSKSLISRELSSCCCAVGNRRPLAFLCDDDMHRTAISKCHIASVMLTSLLAAIHSVRLAG